MKNSKKVYWIATLLIITTSNGQKNSAFASSFFAPYSPLYAGGYVNKSKINITIDDNLSGTIYYHPDQIQLDSFKIINSKIITKPAAQVFDLYDKNLKKIEVTNSLNQHLKIVRIPNNNGYLHRVLLDTLNVVLYDQMLDFVNNNNINTKSFVIQYDNELYSIPRRMKRRTKMIDHIIRDEKAKEVLTIWLREHL